MQNLTVFSFEKSGQRTSLFNLKAVRTMYFSTSIFICPSFALFLICNISNRWLYDSRRDIITNQVGLLRQLISMQTDLVLNMQMFADMIPTWSNRSEYTRFLRFYMHETCNLGHFSFRSSS